MNSQWTKSKDFSTTQLLNLGLETIFERGKAENDEIRKSSFPFQPQTKTVKINGDTIILAVTILLLLRI
jgi:hypothetical protein